MRAPRFRLRSLMVLVGIAAAISAAIAPSFRPPPKPRPGWLSTDGSVVLIRMPDGSLVAIGVEKCASLRAKYLDQMRRYYGVNEPIGWPEISVPPSMKAPTSSPATDFVSQAPSA